MAGPQTSIRIGVEAREANAKLRSLTGEFNKAAGDIKSNFADRITSSLGPVGGMLGKAGPLATGALAVAGAFAAMGAAATGVAKAANTQVEQMQRLADQNGVTVQSFSAMASAAGKFGADAEDVSDVIGDLRQKALNNEKDFEGFGIAVRDAGGRLLSTEQIVGNFADRLAQASTETEAFAIADDLASDAGRRLLPILKNGAAGLEAYKQAAADAGAVISETEEATNREFTAALREAWGAVKNITRSIGTSFQPALTSLLDVFVAIAPVVVDFGRGMQVLFGATEDVNKQWKEKTRPNLEAETAARKEAAEAVAKQRKELREFAKDQMTDAELLGEAADAARQLGRAFESDALLTQAERARSLQESIRVALDIGSSPERLEELRSQLADVTAGARGFLDDFEAQLAERVERRTKRRKAGADRDKEAEERAKEQGQRVGEAFSRGVGEAAQEYRRKLALAEQDLLNAAAAEEGEEDRRDGLGFAGRLQEDFGRAIEVVAERGTAMNAALSNVATESVMVFANMGSSLSGAFEAAFSGGDFGAALQQLIGQQLVALGTQLVNAGVYTLAMGALAAIPIIGTAFGGPPAASMAAALAPVAIGAGVGLIAAGSAMNVGGQAIQARAQARGGRGAGGGRGGPGGGARRFSEPRRIGPDFGRGRGDGQPGQIVIQIAPGGVVGGDGRRVGRDVAGVLRQAGVQMGGA